MLTAQTRIRVKAPLPLPRKRELTGDTRIRLSQIVDLKDWIEDQKYEVGQISSRTGLLKTTEGWVVPPHAAFSMKPEEGPRGRRLGGGSSSPQTQYSDNYQENKRKLTSVFEVAKKKLNSEEIKAVKNYTKTSKEINAFSRGEKVDSSRVPQLKAQQDALDSALLKSEVGENVIAYRTISIPQDKLDSIIPTQNIPISKVSAGSRNLYLQKTLETTPIRSTEKGYISTTINPNYQMNRQNAGEAFFSYKINVPKKAHGLYLGKLSAKKHQDELLVLRNYSLDFKKIKYDARSDRYEIEADLLLE